MTIIINILAAFLTILLVGLAALVAWIHERKAKE